MAKYRLCIRDENANKFYVPFRRDGNNFQEKVDLYEIDMVTITLGDEKFISALKQCNLAPSNFDWNHVSGYIEYTMNQVQKYLPLIFERDALLIQMINLENKYRHHQGMSESRVVNMICEKPTGLPDDLKQLLGDLKQYRDYFLNEVLQVPELIENPNLSKKIRQQIHSWMESVTYDEKKEYENDLLKQMLSYINLRRMKATEHGIRLHEAIVDLPQVLHEDEDRIDSDEFAFLTEEEMAQIRGEVLEKDGKSYGG